MKINDDGHFYFESNDEVADAMRLVRAIHKEGYVNTDEAMWKLWLTSECAKKVRIEHITILVWTTIFLPKLMWSLICDFSISSGL